MDALRRKVVIAMIRILFVEDDAVVMSNLRRVLSVMRGHWDMRFASSGEEALMTLADRDRPFDVVVADNKMPGMLGSELLSIIQYSHSRVVRVLLLETDETEAAIRNAGVAHRLMRKPCDPDQLLAAIERTCELEQRLNDPDLQALIGQLGSLPSPSRTVIELNDLLAQPEATAQDIAGVIESDGAMTAKLLQVVNSAYFSLSHTIADVSSAVTYLGVNAVRDLCVSMELLKSFNTGPTFVQTAIDEIHEHSLAVAHVARQLMSDRASGNEAFVAALLHDVGLLVIATQMPERFLELRVQVMRSSLSLAEVELEVIGAHHADIGAHILELWGLPSAIVEAVGRHHDAADIPCGAIDTLHALHVADAIVSGFMDPTAGAAWEQIDALEPEYLNSLGIGDTVARLIATPVG